MMDGGSGQRKKCLERGENKEEREENDFHVENPEYITCRDFIKNSELNLMLYNQLKLDSV